VRGPHVLDEAQLAALSGCSTAQHAAALLAIDHLSVVPAMPRAALLAEARGWLADCGWQADVEDVDDALVVQTVRRRYDGGWSAFVVANVDLLDVGWMTP